MGEAVRTKTGRWSNPSVRLLAGQEDPLDAMLRRARETVLRAMDKGWSGPPFDPIALSGILGIPVFPRADIRDARTVPQGDTGVCIEYNPTRPRGRLRYSVAHEIAHTLFPDCTEQIRNRSAHHEMKGDEWQLEMLCNIGAAEFLMPIGSLQRHLIGEPTINRVLAMRSQFDVSTEAVLIRLAQMSERPCGAFVASRVERGTRAGRYRFDYVISSRTWAAEALGGELLPDQSVVQECTAIGYTAKGEALFSGFKERVHIECVGIPPYPGSLYPRVAGLMSSATASDDSLSITYLKGSALEPRGDAAKIIAHIVSDATPNWGGRSFAVAVKQKWPDAQREFRTWAESNRRHLALGQVHLVRVSDEVTVANMVCQKGYGPSAQPRIRYAALEECLKKLAEAAKQVKASVHMPRIGTGQAGGAWFIVEELVRSALPNAGVSAFVYDLPEGSPNQQKQMELIPSLA
jgi:Zn-dependent peptidase ImmA (M78 family)/O-acetyl-ADP-ribose deacetylase (regulator of RNase III)